MGHTITPNFNKRINIHLFASIFLTLFFIPTLTQGQFSVNITPTHVKCFGGNNGAATASATGGVSPYTYAWGGGQTGATVSNLSASTVNVTVTDNTGATKTASAVINQPSQLGVTVYANSQICTNTPDGNATAVPFTGTPPYTYLWSNGSTSAQILHLVAGTYVVTVTDANGCKSSAQDNVISWNEGIWVMDTVYKITCFGANNGGIHITAMSGTAPYSYNWNTGATGSDLTNLSPGTYTVTVSDVNGCSHVREVSVAQPTILNATASSTNASCGNTGTISLTISGGSNPYTVLWNNGSTNTNLSNLGAGTYTATIKDKNNCSKTVSTTVSSSNTALTVTTTLVSNATCLTGGSATASATGSGSLTYAWDNGQTSATATNLSAGIHTVLITNTTSGCSGTGTINIVQTGGPTASAAVTLQATCSTGASAAASATGGTAPYNYKWDNNQLTPNATNLSIGNHTVTVTDAGGCSSIGSVNIAQPQSPNVATSVVSNATCSTGGSASAVGSGGAGSYVYLWDNNQTTATATNLSVGAHTVTVTDAGGCSKVGSVTITGQTSGGPTATATATTQATCTTGGSATASATGGNAPYSYKWDNLQTTAIGTNLIAGPHTVTVTDASGCTSVATVTIAQQSGPTVTTTVISNATCLTGGSASVSAGAGSFTYKWDNLQTTTTATNLIAGPHAVTVTDAAGCTKVGNVTITAPQNPTSVAAAITQATCLTGGSATASATGGTAPYTYKWDNLQTTATGTNLSAAAHTVTITDANGCTSIGSVTITKTPNPTLTASQVTGASCVTGGSATAIGAGGTAPYAYKWDNNQTTATGTNLLAGPHTVTVTDAGGCTGTASVTISGTPAPTATITSSANAKCDQAGSATVAANGGTAPYTYKWDNNETTASAINLAAGAHTVTVTDAGGCTASTSVTIGLTNNGIKIGDYVWYDTDQDGFQDPQDIQGVPNISVMLIRAGTDGIFGTADDVTVKSTTTNASGKYEFGCVTPGTYIIMFGTIPTGYEFTRKDNVNNDCLDSDVNANGKTAQFTVIAGQTDNFCFDAGIHTLCDNVNSAGQVCCNQTICEGTAPAPLTTTVAAFGGTGAIQYQWLQFLDGGQAGPLWVGINGATAETYSPGILTQTSFFMRCARRAGCVEFLESNIVTITVNAFGTPGCGMFLTNFNVNLLSAQSVEVAWATNPELSQYMYYVQHSSDNINWTTVGEVMGHNDATGINTYKMIHDAPEVGTNFYRIKRLDASNLSVFSDAIELKMSDLALEESVAINPNPVTNNMSVKNLMVYDNDVNVKISTTNGVVLYDLNIPAGSLQKFELGMDHLPNGIYLARVRFSKSVVKTIKLVKI
jgi:SdrD B-like domain/SprB repeat